MFLHQSPVGTFCPGLPNLIHFSSLRTFKDQSAKRQRVAVDPQLGKSTEESGEPCAGVSGGKDKPPSEVQSPYFRFTQEKALHGNSPA